jgi:hypothetical protein
VLAVYCASQAPAKRPSDHPHEDVKIRFNSSFAELPRAPGSGFARRREAAANKIDIG